MGEFFDLVGAVAVIVVMLGCVVGISWLEG